MKSHPAKDSERLAELYAATTDPMRSWDVAVALDALQEVIGIGVSALAELDARETIQDRLTQERDAALRQYGDCVNEFSQAKGEWIRERDEARRSAEALKPNCARYMKLGHCPPNDLCSLHYAAQPAPDDVERARVPTLLQRAEQLWDDLQKDELGGFSGINRPFWIVQAFKEVDAVARREGAELRALDEAVIAAARVVVDNTPIGRFTYLRDALAARDAAKPKDSLQC